MNGRYEKGGFRAEIDANPSPEVVRDVEFLRARLEASAVHSGVPSQPFQITPNQVPDAARSLVAVVKRMFNVDVRFVTAGGLPESLNFDGIHVGRNTVYVNSDSTAPFSQVIGHELLHFLRHTAPDLNDTFGEAIPVNLALLLGQQVPEPRWKSVNNEWINLIASQ